MTLHPYGCIYIRFFLIRFPFVSLLVWSITDLHYISLDVERCLKIFMIRVAIFPWNIFVACNTFIYDLLPRVTGIVSSFKYFLPLIYEFALKTFRTKRNINYWKYKYWTTIRPNLSNWNSHSMCHGIQLPRSRRKSFANWTESAAIRISSYPKTPQSVNNCRANRAGEFGPFR